MATGASWQATYDGCDAFRLPAIQPAADDARARLAGLVAVTERAATVQGPVPAVALQSHTKLVVTAAACGVATAGQR